MLLDVPTLSGKHLSMEIANGERLFIIGANGSGKSALIQHIVSSNRDDRIKRITAHRQTAFDSERATFTYPDREQFEQQTKNWDLSFDSRWREDRQFGQQKHLATLSDFIARENAQARSVRNLVRQQKLNAARDLVNETLSPLERINHLFRIANITATLTLSDDGEFLAHHGDENAAFRIAHLSDGERSATIMAATVLIVEAGTVLLIDEPERHLHRSIVVPFLSALFEQRQDCSFIISTHEISLPISSPQSRVLLVHRCEWSGSNATAWEANIFDASEELPEELKLAILGARQRILFVEGEEHSLDQTLYGALFPGVLVVSKGSCGEVQRSVNGLRDTESTHHVRAFGLIDADGRSQEEMARLVDSGVFALNVNSVESLYYCSDVIASVAKRQAIVRDDDADRLFEQTCENALTKVTDDLAEKMAARRCERSVRRKALSKMPDWKELRARGDNQRIDISIESTYEVELKEFKRQVHENDLDGLVARYPLRYSNLLQEVARTLKCLDRNDYEKIAIALIREDEGLARKLRDHIGILSIAISA